MDGDGNWELLYADETAFRIFDALTGRLAFETPNSSITFIENPVVSDVDGDCHAEIVTCANKGICAFPAWGCVGGGQQGIRVLHDVDSAGQETWVNARPVWNQHSYHVTNVNNDGTLPSPERNNWTFLNNYRVQVPNRPPDCSGAPGIVQELWPPDHKMVRVTLTGVADTDGDPVHVSVDGVWQDEPVDGLGDGSTTPDAIVSGPEVELRSERSGLGDGRVYHVSFSADDGGCEACRGTVTVCVPHDQRPGHVCGD